MSIKRFNKLGVGLLLAWLCLASSVFAQISVEVVGGEGAKITLVIPQFTGAAAISEIVRADLERSGQFRVVLSEIQDADYLVQGSGERLADGSWRVSAALVDRNKKTVSNKTEITGSALRLTAHRLADAIYAQITGVEGVFSSRIAYVVKRQGRYELQVADADGYGAVAALISPQPIISPDWSPDGNQLAYVSFENNKPVIYIQSLTTGERYPLANFKGSNSSPAWSPDGKRLAVVLTKDGGSQLYMIQANGSGLIRLTRSSSIDTEPAWSADGHSLYFTSDRGGGPQIYRLNLQSGQVDRITFEGDYNVSASPSADGKYLAYVSRRNGQFVVAVLDLANQQVQLIGEGGRDESPSFAFNSRMLIYAADRGRERSLMLASVDGRYKQRISTASGEIREPVWGPRPRLPGAAVVR